MFQGQLQHVEIPFPFKGINTNGGDDTTYAQFIQNLYSIGNKKGQMRYGTGLFAQTAFDAQRPFLDIIETMPFLRADGQAEIVTYIQYFTPLQFITLNANFNLIATDGTNTASRITINLQNYTEQQREYFKKVLFNDVRLLVSNPVGLSEYAEIKNYILENNNLNFVLDFPPEFFHRNLQNAFDFVFFVERAGLYRILPNGDFELIVDNLDPCVIVSYVNFKGVLLIANGVDNVKVYNGVNATDLQGQASIPFVAPPQVNQNTITFNILATIQQEIQTFIKVNSVITCVVQNQADTNLTVTNIQFGQPANQQIAVTITTNNPAPANIKKILYSKLCPPFSYLAIAHKRLWALGQGRSYFRQFRNVEYATKLYYATKFDSYTDWYDDRTNQISFYDVGSTAGVPDNLEVVTQFENYIFLIGRETTQVWQGDDPTVVGQFVHVETLPIGIIHPKMWQEIPNYFVFFSKLKIAALNTQNLIKRLDVAYSFSNRIDDHIKNQLLYIETNRDFRNMRSFIYPFGRFIGFRIKYSCFIYQINEEGSWVVFSENFANATSFLYDPTSQNLFLGLDKGTLVIYTDKAYNANYTEYNFGKISMRIDYNWAYVGNSWTNTHIYIGCKSLKSITVNYRFFRDLNETTSITSAIEIDQAGVLYDLTQYNQRPYSYVNTIFSQEVCRFTCDALLIEMSALSDGMFVYDKLFLGGGTNSDIGATNNGS